MCFACDAIISEEKASLEPMFWNSMFIGRPLITLKVPRLSIMATEAESWNWLST